MEKGEKEKQEESKFDEYRDMSIPLQGGGQIDITVNWNKEVTPSKYIKLKWDDKEGVVWRGDLHNIMLMLANLAQQKELIQKDFASVKSYDTILGIKAHRAVEVGEELKIACTIQYDPNGMREPKIFTTGKTPIKSQFEI